jgi:biotin transport system substrate-specific component
MRDALALPFIEGSILRRLSAAVLGTAVLALSSYVEVPMIPVPMTMQTLAVTVIGALFGWRLGAATVIAWLIEAAAGLPGLAGGAFGLAPFVGPTAGYLYSFPLMAALTGYLAGCGWNRHLALGFSSLLAANALCLVCGAVWLAALVGAGQAMALGVLPFVAGGAVKSAIGAVALKLLAR